MTRVNTTDATTNGQAKPDERYLQSLQKRYAKAGKKESGQMLDKFMWTTGLA